MTKYQSGFRPWDSTVNQLLEIYNIIIENLDKGKDVRFIFVMLVKHLIRYGIMAFYLNSRSMEFVVLFSIGSLVVSLIESKESSRKVFIQPGLIPRQESLKAPFSGRTYSCCILMILWII